VEKLYKIEVTCKPASKIKEVVVMTFNLKPEQEFEAVKFGITNKDSPRDGLIESIINIQTEIFETQNQVKVKLGIVGSQDLTYEQEHQIEVIKMQLKDGTQADLIDIASQILKQLRFHQNGVATFIQD
jgi:hypothetical protein